MINSEYQQHLIKQYQREEVLRDKLALSEDEVKELNHQIDDFKLCIGSIIGLANRKMKNV